MPALQPAAGKTQWRKHGQTLEMRLILKLPCTSKCLVSQCLNPQTSHENGFRGSKHLLKRYLEDFGCLGLVTTSFFQVTFWFPKWRSQFAPEKRTLKTTKKVTRKNLVGGGFQYFRMCPYLGRWSNLTLTNILKVKPQASVFLLSQDLVITECQGSW